MLISAILCLAAPVQAQALPTRSPLKLGVYGQLRSQQFTEADGLPKGPITWMRIIDDNVAVGGEAGFARFDGTKWGRGPSILSNRNVLAPDGTRSLSTARTRGGETWLTAASGAFRIPANGKASPLELPRVFAPNQPVPHIDSVLRYVANDAAGHVWIATDQGAYATDGKNWWDPLNRSDGMPYEDMHCILPAKNGDLWGGTTEGAWRLRGSEWRYFWGKRWLPGNTVYKIVEHPDGSIWLATSGGVARIWEQPTTLAKKAEHYEAITAARHNRRGWVTECNLTTPGKPEAGFVHEASDNDGLWTAIYLGAESLRYAATKDPAAKALAKKSMEALLDLVRKSGFPGFPARAIIEKGEKVTGYNPDETVRIDGEPDKIWYTSPTHPNLLCKGDTSSDELDGHYFAWYLYFKHVADEAEKDEIRKVVRAVMDNLLQHDYTLVGHTGRKTRWGVFGPKYLNEDPRWFDERGLNSAELLCYLAVANYICGDARFRAAYDDLINNHHYLLNIPNYRRGATWDTINHSDDELAFVVYYPLLEIEKDPARRAFVLRTMAANWQDIRQERSPFYNFIYGAATGAPCEADLAAQTLQEWPWELVNWQVKNSHRHDITLRRAKGVARTETDRVLPVGERYLMRWASNPWQPDGGGNGSGEEDAGAWLLGYWLGRYHQLIVE